MIRNLFIALCLLIAIPSAYATPGPDEVMSDPALEARAEQLYTLLRCVVCQSESLAGSNAALAEDMRTVVREHLLAGESNQEILDFMQIRYGDYVLLMPPFQANTLALWLLPLIMLICGGGMAYFFIRRQSYHMDEDLTDEEEAQIKALMKDEGF
jgi:cytochrome c-type biogenesis protein CcmH